MSHVSETTASSLTEGNPVTSLTLVVLLLVPCVVVLLLLNCLLLGYKLLILSKKKIRLRPERTEEMLLRSPQGVRLSDVAFPLRQDGRRAYLSLSEPVLPHPVTSSRASSRERIGLDHRIRLLRPDGATGSGSQRAPSWRKSAQVLPHDSGTETRLNLVPPNTPMVTQFRAPLTPLLPLIVCTGFLVDKVDMECEYTNLHSEASCLNASAAGPGLDSDFGASAGVSLRILSADSDGLSNGVLASALEWDYYDPCYVKQNNIPKHKHHRPAIHMKQYWV
uniref:Huluwa n=1 Tax=Oreochromis niloticus TaxID=8128 RepID=A0A669E5T5_ORENI